MKKITALWTYIETRPEFRGMGYAKGLAKRAEQISLENGACIMIGYITKPDKTSFFDKLGHVVVNKDINKGKCIKHISGNVEFSIPQEIKEIIEEINEPTDERMFPDGIGKTGKYYKITWYSNDKLVGFTKLKILEG